jgi:hypothetical protein
MAALAGCNRGPERVPIKGTVTYQGRPVAEGSLTFVPSAADKNTMEGAMIVEGKYAFAAGKGLFPGEYKVSISAPAEKAAAVSGPPGAPRRMREAIPERYNADTTLTIDVTAAGSHEFDFNLQ